MARRGRPAAGDGPGPAGGPAPAGAGGGGAGAGGGQQRAGSRSAWRWPRCSRGCPTSCASGTPCGEGAAEPLWEADRHLLVGAERSWARCGRWRSAPAAATRRGPTPPLAWCWIRCWRSGERVRERGGVPFDFAALRVLDRLEAVGQTLDRLPGKRRDSGLARLRVLVGHALGAAGPRASDLRRVHPPATRPGPRPGAGRPRAGPPPRGGATVRTQVELLLGHLPSSAWPGACRPGCAPRSSTW